MATRVSATDILRMRLSSQRITAPAASVTDTVRHLLAVQAQDFAQALWAIGLRTASSTRSDVLAALESGDVVRSMPMRGTLHFTAAEDLGWMLSLTAERTLASANTRRLQLGLDDETLRLAASVSAEALAGNALGRNDYLAMLAGNGISVEGQRGYYIIFHLTQLGLLCWGPPSGTQQALVLNEEWIRQPRQLDRDEALRELGIRYFTGHGPATVRDLAWWTKLTLADARTAVAAASTHLTELDLDGVSYWASTSEVDAAPGTLDDAVHALPGFDEYLLGYQDRSLPLAEDVAQRIVPGKNGIFLAVIVAQGRVVGRWRRATKGDGIEPELFEALTRAQGAALEWSARARAAFLA